MRCQGARIKDNRAKPQKRKSKQNHAGSSLQFGRWGRFIRRQTVSNVKIRNCQLVCFDFDGVAILYLLCDLRDYQPAEDVLLDESESCQPRPANG